MVMLKRLYSDTGLFDEVEFKMGINLIRGIYTKSPEEISDLNGIGKSSLIRLIDYCLLSDAGKKFFSEEKKPFFKEQSATLEFEVDGKNYYIRREFSSPSKAFFGYALNSMDEYSDTELRTVLGGLFFGKDNYKGAFDNGWFRRLIKFFIKDDINHHERKDPLKFTNSNISNFEAYVYNLFLLGLPNQHVNEFTLVKKEAEDLLKMRKRITERLKEETGKDLGEVNSEISVIDKKIKTYQESLLKYEFLSSYENVEKELVSISGKVSSLLRKLTPIEKRLSEYRKSYEYEIEIDPKKITKLYSEVKVVFGDAVKKQIEEVLSFRKKLAENRKKFLSGKEVVLSNEIEELKSKIVSLEKKRSSLYKILDEKKALDSIKNTYQLLIEEKSRKEKLDSTIQSLGRIEDDLIIKNKLKTEAVSQISADLNAVKDKISDIREIFLDIVSETVNINNPEDAVFDIRPASDMKSPVKVNIEVPKSDALGKKRFKILTYDLTVFLNLIDNDRMLPHFLVHDGVFHGIGIKTVIKVLNMVNSKFLQSQNFQYIITANENEILIPDDKKKVWGDYSFDMNGSIRATYKDIPEEMIFKREY